MLLRLREWRQLRGYSTRQLAERAGVGFVTISRIENQRISPTVSMLEKLARALEISVRDFFPVDSPGRRTNKRSTRRR